MLFSPVGEYVSRPWCRRLRLLVCGTPWSSFNRLAASLPAVSFSGTQARRPQLRVGDRGRDCHCCTFDLQAVLQHVGERIEQRGLRGLRSTASGPTYESHGSLSVSPFPCLCLAIHTRSARAGRARSLVTLPQTRSLVVPVSAMRGPPSSSPRCRAPSGCTSTRA